MNQCLTNPTDDEVRSALAVEDAVATGTGRVLLLEDDVAFKEVIEDFLVENGFEVVAVQNGREGIQEIMTGDFALVLCDMSMPTMPGDMFYRAVERIRPDVCERFIFMTGYRGDVGKSDFIKSINGYVLPKPFSLKDLQDSIAFTEVRRTFRSVFESDDGAGRPSQVCPTTDPYLAKMVPFRTHEVAVENSEPPPSVPAAVALPAAPAAPEPRPVPVTPRVTPRVEDPPQLPAAVSDRAFAFAGLALLVALAGLLGFQYLEARDGAAAAVAERRTIEAKWNEMAAQREEIEKTSVPARSDRKAAPGPAARVAMDRARPRWTPALRGLVMAAGEPIGLIEIHTYEEPEDSGACEVRVRGTADGTQPRLEADRFRKAVEEELKRDAGERPVSARIEHLEDALGEIPGQQRVAFEIIAAVGRVPSGAVANREGR